METALVTGGAGFIGRHLVRDLLDSGFRVKVVDSGETGQLDRVPGESELVVADIASYSVADWDQILADVDELHEQPSSAHKVGPFVRLGDRWPHLHPTPPVGLAAVGPGLGGAHQATPEAGRG